MAPKLKLLLSFQLFNAGMWDAKIYAHQNLSFGGSRKRAQGSKLLNPQVKCLCHERNGCDYQTQKQYTDRT